MDTKKDKSKGEQIHATISQEQYNAIQKLDGIMGVGINGVVANIINQWFSQQEWYKDILCEKVKKQ